MLNLMLKIFWTLSVILISYLFKQFLYIFINFVIFYDFLFNMLFLLLVMIMFNNF